MPVTAPPVTVPRTRHDRRGGRGRSRRRIAVCAALLAGAALAVPVRPAVAATPCGDPAVRPWCRTSLSPARRAALLLAEMTFREKVSMLAADDPLGGPLAGFDENLHTDTIAAIDRLGVPELHFADGPAGVRQGRATALPAPIALAAGFDPAAARRYGDVVGYETRHRGNDVVFGPSVDVLRSPRYGRGFEGYGEDPLLAADMGVGWIQGAQRQGVLASVKHLGVYTQETDRMELDSRVGARALREIYLPPFEAAVKEGKAAVMMCAYGKLNGTDNCHNGTVNNGIVRGEWGFGGFIASDHTAVRDTVAAMRGGLDLELPVGLRYNTATLALAVHTGRLTRADVDARVTNLLRTLFAHGVFDRPPHPNDLTRLDHGPQRRTAAELAEGGLTLLKNDGVLPLRSPRSLALIGGGADVLKHGYGSSQVDPFTHVTPAQGIAARAGDATIVRRDGRDRKAAAKAARDAEVAIVFVTDSQGEFFDKSCLTLRCGDPTWGDQDALVGAVAAANPRTVVVMLTGGPVLTPWASRVPGVVAAWYPGQEGGTALARMLYGDVDPGGRLPVTFPMRESDAPVAGDPERFPGVGKVATYSEGVFIGYRHYDARGRTPRFPFGHGLSYTTFRYGGLSVADGGAGAAVRVTATVTNTGRRPGVAVPQLYLGMPAPDVETSQPPRQLKGYHKISLRPGESRRVEFPLSRRALSYWHEASSSWRVAAGCYRVMVGASSRDIALTGGFRQGEAGFIGECPQ